MKKKIATLIGAAAAAIALLLTVAPASAKPTPPPAPYTPQQEVVSKVVTATGVFDGSSGQFLFTTEVDCSTGKVPIGGGFRMRPDVGPGPSSPRLPQEDRPTAAGWRVAWGVADDRQATAEVYAVCIAAS